MNKKIFPLLLLLPVVFLLGRLSAQEDVQPSCLMCAAEYVSLEEISKYMQVGRDKGITDQQLRSIDVGRAKVQIAVAHRGRLEQRIGRVAEHDLVTEVYYVLSGSGDIMTSPELIDSVRRADDNRAVMTLNGPGHNAADVRNGVSHQLKAGDVFIIPAGTGHEFTRIPDHITYLMIRVDPDKVVPLMNADESANYLDEQL
ncbi:MAG: AraC family ligand binding domain-containing protein [Proteobacteria bacterium]|nr:AraC family ligand binding domain-containing protein [Pseudomonadota bacterium]